MFKLKKDLNKKGFTLVELMIAMAVVSVLTAIAFTAFLAVRKTGRDTVRKQNLRQYMTGIEQYRANNDYYPTDIEGLAVLYPEYMSTAISDPDSSTITAPMTYVGNDEGSDYVLYTELEMGGYWVVCSSVNSGKIGKLDIAPGSWTDTCPL